MGTEHELLIKSLPLLERYSTQCSWEEVVGAGESTQQLRALAALTEDPVQFLVLM